MFRDLLDAIERSNPGEARAALDSLLDDGIKPWTIHESLFQVVQRVRNPPFINPHLPKMYAINRELAPFLEPDDVAMLVRVEVEEYAQREKLPSLRQPLAIPAIYDFNQLEKPISSKDVEATAATLYAYMTRAGPTPLSRNLLIQGSDYLDQSLGHSISCTTFMLIEMIFHRNDDPWPVLAAIGEYFCAGNFSQKPKLQYLALSDYPEVHLLDVKRAVSGTGIVALHHTITLYAIERSKHFWDHSEYDHGLTMWRRMLGDKEEDLYPIEEIAAEPFPDFTTFFEIFLEADSTLLLGYARNILGSEKGRHRFAGFLIKAVLRCYNGRYNPHYLTGLGSSLWLIDRFHDHADIVLNGLHQYLDYFYSGVDPDPGQ